MSGLDVGSSHLGWEVTGPAVPVGRALRAPAKKADREGAVWLFPIGAPDDPHAAVAARWAKVRAVQHPALVQAEGEKRDDGFVVALPNFERLGDSPLTPVQALAMLQGIVAAVGAVHAAGLVHGELDAWSIVKDEGVLKVLGPGLRAPPRGLEALGLAADPRYAAPEVLDGRPATQASDWFSVGLLLYRLLVGRPPAPADDPPEGFVGRVADLVPDLGAARNDLPAPVLGLYGVLCHRDPRLRPADPAEAAGLCAAAEKGKAPAPRALQVKPFRPATLGGPLAAAVTTLVACVVLWQILQNRLAIPDPLEGVEVSVH